MPKVSEQHLEAQRARIIAAAVACFAEKGFHKTSMRDIFKEAELSPGAVYNYFESKEAIIEAVCQLGRQEHQSIFQQQNLANGDLEAQVDAGLNGYREMLFGIPMREAWLRADIMFTAEALINPDLAKTGTANYQMIIEHLTAIAQRWIERGWVRPEHDAAAIAQVMFATVQGLGLQIIINPQLDLDAYFGVVKALLIGKFVQ